MDKQETAKKITEELLEKLGVEASIDVNLTSEDIVNINISGENLGILIGYHGQTLQSLQLVLTLMLAKRLDSFQRIVIDVSDWRKNREETLTSLAQRIAKLVATSGEPQVLSDLPPWQRRAIHLALKDHPQVVTESQGEGLNRQLIVKPKP